MKRPMRTEVSELNLSRRGVPKHLMHLEIEDFHNYDSEERAEVGKLIKDYLKNIESNFDNNVGIFLYGSNGTGKTFLASLIVKEAYIYRYTSRRCTFMDYINEYTKLWGIKDAEKKEEEEGLFYHNYKSVEFLVLEELGKELDTKLSPTVLEDLLRYREERGLVTIICTNLAPKEIVERYGASISSLIKGNFRPIMLVGKDNRTNVFKGRV
jgi:DNA replication protein DnaC